MKKKLYHSALIMNVVFLFLFNAPLFASDLDNLIELSAEQSYVFKTYLKGDDIMIQSIDGVVALTGTVSEESHKSLARETVASLPGVKRVDNKLEVKGETSTVYTDSWLITKVKSTLFFHRNVSAAQTEVFAKDGTITLRGEAASVSQKDLATEYAMDVEGVKNVINEMSVSTAAMKSGKKTGEKAGVMIESIDDASITALVKTTLLYHRSTSGLSTTVETTEGVVNLGGKAKNPAEKDLATKIVSDVYGVNRVVNNMTIEGTEAKAK